MPASKRLLVAACGLALSLVLAAIYQSSRPAGTPRISFSSTRVETALRQRLHGEGLSYEWVTCVPTFHVYQRRRLFRCNVNFGDPHVEPYCATLIGHSLLTDHQNSRLSCGRRVRRDELNGDP
jgi:hypothetical protein